MDVVISMLLALCAYIIMFFGLSGFSLYIAGGYGRNFGISLILTSIGYCGIYKFFGFKILCLVFIVLTLAIGSITIIIRKDPIAMHKVLQTFILTTPLAGIAFGHEIMIIVFVIFFVLSLMPIRLSGDIVNRDMTKVLYKAIMVVLDIIRYNVRIVYKNMPKDALHRKLDEILQSLYNVLVVIRPA